ncbi:hypothetical protein CCP3SC1AL1_240032 [Gammaproteobacteria bacterium]
MIQNSVMLKLRNNKYFDSTFATRIEIDKCKNQYEVFEKVFTTVAADNKLKWQEIYHANNKSTRKFILLCICCILVDKFLRSEFRIKIEDRSILLGFYKNELVRYYYRFN